MEFYFLIILDTHIWLWWISKSDKLKPSQLKQIEQANQVGVSAISLFEVSWLDTHKKIKLSCQKNEWFDNVKKKLQLVI